jgi:hypothetical protein
MEMLLRFFSSVHAKQRIASILVFVGASDLDYLNTRCLVTSPQTPPFLGHTSRARIVSVTCWVRSASQLREFFLNFFDYADRVYIVVLNNTLNVICKIVMASSSMFISLSSQDSNGVTDFD